MSVKIERELVIDPVCGMRVSADAPLAYQYEGVTYHFCAESCLQRFRADPARYLGAKKAPEAGLAHVVHTCPMHPEVRQIGPGTCPKCGMALEPVGVTAQDPFAEEHRDMRRRFLAALGFTLPVFALSMGGMLLGGEHHSFFDPTVDGWAQLLLATPAVFWAGWPIHARGLASLRARSLNMFTLLSLGTSVAWLASVAALLRPQSGFELYFESAATITTLALLGQVLELGARRKTGAALRELLDLAPKTAWKVDPLGDEREVPLEQVEPGYVLRVKPGGAVPVDGVVLEGEALVDESMLTGESAPVRKSKSDRVVGGTVLASGSITLIAERVGSETVLARIVELVASAQRSRAPIQQLADRVAGWFVPLVVAAALVTFVAWSLSGVEQAASRGLVAAVSVLIVACPCALGLATPMSIVVATSRGAKEGVLFRDAEALQRLEQVEVLCVDKTGTLTEGKPRVVAIERLGSASEDELLALAAAVERQSEHPLALAIVAAAQQRGLELDSADKFANVAGRGASGVVAGKRVALGSAAYFAELGVAASQLAARADELARAGRGIVFLAVDGRAEALIVVEDPLRATTREALAHLARERVEVRMLTGDRRATAEAIARELGLAHVDAETTPASKAEIVRALQSSGRSVAMAGDGINDAPALAAADVGIAMGGGTDVAKETAAVTLMHGDLRTIARARALSRATMRNVRQNLAFAFGYNALCIPVAAGALYPFTGLLLSPMLAALAMTFSSVSVIANALRLRAARLR